MRKAGIKKDDKVTAAVTKVSAGKRGVTGFAEAGTAKAFSAIQASLRTARDPQVEEIKKLNNKADNQIDVLGDILDAVQGQEPGVVIA